MSKTKSLIGKKYVPVDNSWSVNVTDCGNMLSRARRSYLAGTSTPHTPAKDCIIVSEPFMCSVETIGIDDQLNKHKMIIYYAINY